MSSLAKTDLVDAAALAECSDALLVADYASIEARVLASMTPRELAAGYVRRGYRRISRRHRVIARVDREDWVTVLAAHLGKSTAELCLVVEARNRVGYAITNEVSDVWADYYRRVLSKDCITVAEEVMLLVPTSDHDPVAYVSRAQLFAEGYGGGTATGRAVYSDKNVPLAPTCPPRGRGARRDG